MDKRKKRAKTIAHKDQALAIRIRAADRDAVIAAASRDGISICEFTRRCLTAELARRTNAVGSHNQNAAG